MRTFAFLFILGALGLVRNAKADTESLDFDTSKCPKASCVYGELMVLTSINGMYYAVQFDGYAGIQDFDENPRTALFSIWNTASGLFARIMRADLGARIGDFGGEGEGVHASITHAWELEMPYQFFLRKEPGKKPDTTDTGFYVFDRPTQKWRHIATVNAPNGGHPDVEAFTGIGAWMENVGGEADFKKPKIVLYSMWMGNDVDGLKQLTRSGGGSGSGRWGTLHNAFFISEGSQSQLDSAFEKLSGKYGKPTYGVDGQQLQIRGRKLSDALREELKHLPSAPWQGKVVVKKAVYGFLPDGPAKDVTQEVAEIVKANHDVFISGNNGSFIAKFGDPAPQKPKMLRVDYTLDGVAATQTVTGEDTLRFIAKENIPQPVRPTVVKAVYGCLPDGPLVDVTEKVAKAVKISQELCCTRDASLKRFVGVSSGDWGYNTLFGDPAPGQSKALRVDYTLDGVAMSKTVDEGTDFQFLPDEKTRQGNFKESR